MPDLPKLSRPASRALQAAGIVNLDDLSRWSRAEVLSLHGFGPASMTAIDKALNEAGLEFKPPK